LIVVAFARSNDWRPSSRRGVSALIRVATQVPRKRKASYREVASQAFQICGELGSDRKCPSKG